MLKIVLNCVTPMSLEAIAEKVENLCQMGIDVYGFDSGQGLPPPEDYRDREHYALLMGLTFKGVTGAFVCLESSGGCWPSE